MRLTDLIPDYRGHADPIVTNVTQDSRMVTPGSLFVAIPGGKADGLDFVADAIARGAVAIVANRDLDPVDGVVMLRYDDPRRALATIARQYHQARQPETLVMVTGTNGKTSTVHFVRTLWSALGFSAGSIGTLGTWQGEQAESNGGMTTPDTVRIHSTLSSLVDSGVTHLAMEASSHGLKQYRMDGLQVSAAAFTNLTHDHLDYHGTMADYLAAKLRLFKDVLAPDGVAVLNADAPDFTTVAEACGSRRILDFGRYGHALRLVSFTDNALAIDVLGRQYSVETRLTGGFMVMNALCALGLVIAPYLDDRAFIDRAVAALSQLREAPGRMQRVDGSPGRIYVDYAHTPDALENALKCLRDEALGRVICLFGCGGDRDRAKRPVMGRIACDQADIVIVTDDNPRSEDPASIRREILSGCDGKAMEMGDRAAAIRHAIGLLQAGDVLLIAGKGHEQGQTIGDITHPFDDFTEACNALSHQTGRQNDV